jgi:holin-like protein
MKTALKGIMQIAFLMFIAMLSDYAAALLSLPIPGSIVGLLLLFFLLNFNLLPLSCVERGADLLLAELLLFFVPSAVGIVDYQSLLMNSGVELFIVIILGSMLIMALSGFTTNKIAAWRKTS